jgi:hypothetical protein
MRNAKWKTNEQLTAESKDLPTTKATIVTRVTIPAFQALNLVLPKVRPRLSSPSSSEVLPRAGV